MKLLACLIVLASAAGAHAEIYHFVADGVPGYSDRADHPGSVAIVTEGKPAARVAPPASERTRAASARTSGGRSNPEIDTAIDRAAAAHGIEAALLHAVVQVESAYDVRAVSLKGASGLMQLMPATARIHGVRDVFDANANIDGGARHLRQMIDRHQGDLRLALAAYNAGDGAVRRYGGIPPFAETRRYVPAVLDRLARLRAAG